MYIEQRALKPTMTELAADLALHLYARQLEGNTLIVAEKPFEFMRVLRKEWLAVTRVIQAERAKSLDAVRIAEFSRQITHMQALEFTAKPPRDASEDARVFFITEAQVDSLLPFCHTAYVTCGLDNVQQEALKGRIISGGLLVLYESSSVKK